MLLFNIICWPALKIVFTKSQVVAAITAGAFFCIWYPLKEHWLANNILGLAFCIQGIENISFTNGGILLCGFLGYDVFFSSTLVTVTQSLDTPLTLLFPISDAACPCSMFRLGDIVIPGMFVALSLKFDVSRGRERQYFLSAFVGHAVGAIIVMNWFQAAKPALLYTVPCVMGFLVAHSMWNGEVKALLEFDESKSAFAE